MKINVQTSDIINISDTTNNGGYRVESSERTLRILQCFQKPGEKLTLTVISHRSSLPKSTILRLASSIMRLGFLHRDSYGLFSLGAEVRRLGMLTTATVSLETQLRPVIQDLSLRTQETAAFYIRNANDRTCLYCVNSPRSARHHLEEGSRLPLGYIEEGARYPLVGRGGAACSIFLAFGPEVDANPILQEIRKRRWAISDGARDPDLAAVAVPVLNRENEFLGALSVSGLRTRFTTEQFNAIKGLLLKTTTRLAPDLPPLALIDPAEKTGDTPAS